MFSRFENLGEKLLELEGKLSDPSLLSDRDEYRKVSSEHSHVVRLHGLFRSYKKVERELSDSKELLKVEEDDEMREMLKNEILELTEKSVELEKQLRIMLLPKDPNDEKNILLEIRAGTGGDEAALFVNDLFRMYSKYAEMQGWKVEIMSRSSIGIGGYKEIIVLISGDKVYSRLKYESGVHRVQRVPETETQGRIHTSAVTVAVIPETDEVELNIAPHELKFDVFRSSGPGGQSVNTTDSAIRVTHLPTGLVVTCQDEKSQHKNKAKALKVLRSRLYDQMEQERHDKISADRKSQVGSGDRSERIRTYNFPQGRVSDHRINLTLYKLDDIMLGKLDDIILPIITHYQAEALKTEQ
ncbi:MAG: peptide chain release factor 1 [Proteobacteria bacterium]|nr:peptide chain release factor 1 [Pseudomonadota bacterium]MBU1714555.1 peptide chain release factor 1 [Pseudomonadota bacterium]